MYFSNDKKFLYDLLLKWKTYNPGHNILELHNFWVQVQFATSKTTLDICYNKLVYKLVNELLNNLGLLKRLSILGIYEIFEKSQFGQCFSVMVNRCQKHNVGHTFTFCNHIFFCPSLSYILFSLLNVDVVDGDDVNNKLRWVCECYLGRSTIYRLKGHAETCFEMLQTHLHGNE